MVNYDSSPVKWLWTWLLLEFVLVKALSNPPLQWDAHTRAQIKFRTQLNVVYAEVSTPELSAVRQ